MNNIDSIIKKAIKGDELSFSKLIDSNKEKLYRISYMYVKNEQDALDIVSNTVFKAYMNINKLKDPKLFNTWIVRILINTATDQLKKNSKIVYIDDYKQFETSNNTNEFEFNVVNNIDLYNAIDKLDIKYKNLIILKYFEDMTISQISNLLNQPEGTVKVYLSRALRKIKIDLMEECI